MNESTSSKRPRNLPPIIFSLALTVTLLIVAATLWRSQMESKDQLEALSVQNTRLQKELAAARNEIDHLSSGDSSKETKERLAAIRQTRTDQPQQEETENLTLQVPAVSQSDDGITVLLTFESSNSEPPASLALIMRIPFDANSRIITLKPADPSLYSDIKTHINERGTFAVVEGTPGNLEALQFILTVSAPTKVTVQGTSGIKGFELQVSADQAVARNL